MSEIADVATNLRQVDEGLWVSGADDEVSYPADGHESCFALEERSFWFRHRNEVITGLVTAHAPRETLFDIGAGNGYVSLALQRAGIRSVVVEPGARGIEHARARGMRLLVRSTFEGAGFRPASIGSFGLFDVLEHVEDDYAFLRSLHACLRPGGALFVTVPAFPCLWSAEDEQAGHYRRYTARRLSGSLQECGFTAVYCGYFFCPLAPAVLAARAVPSRLGLRGRVSQPTIQREHAAPEGFAGRLLNRALAVEARLIREGKRLPFGSSCVAVARRP